ncbi:hypothetical protein AWRI1631_71870 [Saccharomyces cerevisiae AWRI1631]|uniref:Uncharacterized protein n=1 Tax=Saccharomyces cerevisiae (strain AWRI1631) TaxID=545124 RepID=B5VIR0_YEAS6|nr:hypothetical protein AWRI1631_71870 [Saccharomyces cerevisiae AWRI1631]
MGSISQYNRSCTAQPNHILEIFERKQKFKSLTTES